MGLVASLLWRNETMRRWLTASLLLTIPAAQQSMAQESADARARVQAAVRAETDRVTRRLEVMVGILRYYKLGSSEDHGLMRDAANELSKLSRAEMQAVLDHLEKAAKGPGDAANQTDQAYARHLEVVRKLREISLRYEAIRSLEMAADRLEKSAREQSRLQAAIAGEAARAEAAKASLKDAVGRISDRIDQQRDLNVEVAMLINMAADLEKRLDPERRERLRKGLTEARNRNLTNSMAQLPERFGAVGNPGERADKLRPVLEQSSQVRQTMLAVAKTWRGDTPRADRAAELKARVEEAIEKTREERAELKKPADEARKAEIARETAELAAEVRAIEEMVDRRNPEVDQPLRQAANDLNEAAAKAIHADPAQAEMPLAKAEEALSKAAQALKKAEENAARMNQEPVRRAEEKLRAAENLVQKQREVEQATRAVNDKSPMDTNEGLAAREENLARQAVAEAGAKPETAADMALAEAAKDLQKAAEQLNKPATKQPEAAKAALPREEAARRSLEKAVAEARKELEKARQEALRADKADMATAALERAATMQDEVARQIEKAAEEGRKDPQGDLSRAEAQVQNEVAKAAAQGDPDAAKAAAEAMKKLQETQRDLAKQDIKEAAKDAREAAKALADEVARRHDEKNNREMKELARRAREENAQPALAEAASRLQQATKSAREAEADLAKAAEKAGKPETGSEAVPARQEALAEALKAKNAEAAKAADEAAMALARGENAEAAKAQEKALEALADMAKGGDAEAAAMAKEQEKLLEANKALGKGRQENMEAIEAAKQATGALPGFMKAEVRKAEKLLERAEAAALQGLPMEAAKLEKQAVAQLRKAADQLEAVAKEAGPDAPPDTTLAKETGMPETPGEPMPNQPPPMDSKQPPMGPSNNNPMPTPPGQELPKGTLKPSAEELGRFLRLPPREREALIQAWSEGLPPAHAAMIQRYYRELARTSQGRATP